MHFKALYLMHVRVIAFIMVLATLEGFFFHFLKLKMNLAIIRKKNISYGLLLKFSEKDNRNFNIQLFLLYLYIFWNKNEKKREITIFNFFFVNFCTLWILLILLVRYLLNKTSNMILIESINCNFVIWKKCIYIFI